MPVPNISNLLLFACTRLPHLAAVACMCLFQFLFAVTWIHRVVYLHGAVSDFVGSLRCLH